MVGERRGGRSRCLAGSRCSWWCGRHAPCRAGGVVGLGELSEEVPLLMGNFRRKTCFAKLETLWLVVFALRGTPCFPLHP